MKKTKEQLELLIIMQKHKIDELKVIYSTVTITQTRLGVSTCNTHIAYYLKDKIAKAKMKLNHYKQLLGNTTAVTLPSIKQTFKVGDKVRIKAGWLNSELYVPSLWKYIGLDGEVRSVSETGAYKISTCLDDYVPDYLLYNFPPEALELIP